MDIVDPGMNQWITFDELVFPHHESYPKIDPNRTDKKRLVFGILDWDDPMIKPKFR